MVIYDQRTAISVTRLSANAFPTFSCFSHLYNIYKISSVPFLLQNLHTSASTILSVFPLANHFQNTQSLGEYARISAAAALDGGKEMGPFSRKLSSVHLPSGVCGTYHPGCLELTIFISSLPLTTLSVRLHQVHFCVVRSVRCRCDPRCTKCRRVCLDSDYIPCCANQPIRSTKRNISTSSPCFHIFLSASGMMELNEAAAVVKLLEIQVYFSS